MSEATDGSRTYSSTPRKRLKRYSAFAAGASSWYNSDADCFEPAARSHLPLVSELIDLNFGPAAVLRGVSPRGSTALVFAHPASSPFRVVDGPLGRGVCLMLGSMAAIDVYMPEGSRGCLASIASSVAIPIDKAPASGATEFRSLNLEHPSLLLKLLDDAERCRPEFVFQASFSQRLVRETVQIIAQSMRLPADSRQQGHASAGRATRLQICRRAPERADYARRFVPRRRSTLADVGVRFPAVL